MAFRVGGDEFWSLYFGEHTNMAIERVRKGFARVSVGFVRCEDKTLEQAVNLADKAMYQDKQQRSSAQAAYIN